jgi:uncharacterized membrane protein/membrane-bound inhibitor of C-type lysozyme
MTARSAIAPWGRRLAGVSVLALLTACAAHRSVPDAGTDRPLSAAHDGSDLPMHPQPTGPTYVFDCGADAEPFRFTMRSGPGEIALWLPPRFARPYLVLGQVRAASGARYEEGDVVVWTKGDAATLTVGADTFAGCRQDRKASIWEHAKLSGVDFRAVGNEPPWILEIRREQSLTMWLGYDRQRIVTPHPTPHTDPEARRTTYHAVTEAHDLTVTLSRPDGPCRDSMSGDEFETIVEIQLDGRSYRGCGRPLH